MVKHHQEREEAVRETLVELSLQGNCQACQHSFENPVFFSSSLLLPPLLSMLLGYSLFWVDSLLLVARRLIWVLKPCMSSRYMRMSCHMLAQMAILS